VMPLSIVLGLLILLDVTALLLRCTRPLTG
jgi:hypothetical protein